MRKQNQYVVIITAEAAGPSQPRKGTRLHVSDLAGRPAQVFMNGRMAAVGTVVEGGNSLDVRLTDTRTHWNASVRRK